ncbi:MAG: AraC family transcriptional regulator [Pseudomonadales bacterium]
MAKPLANYRLFDTRDLDEARYQVSQVYCDHKLQSIHGRALDARHHHAPFGDLTFNYMTYGPEVSVEPGYLQDFYLLQLPLQGSAEINCDGQSVGTKAGSASVINPSSYTRMLWSEGCEKLLIQIRREAVEQRLALMLGHPLDQPLRFDVCMQQQHAKHAAWWRTIRFVISELGMEQHCYQDESARVALEKSIINSLICTLHSNYSERLAAQGRSIAPKHVRVAEQYAQDNFRDAISIDDLTAVTGVSARCLFEGFQKFRNTTPMKYLLQVRLEHAHQACLLSGQNRSVTQIALENGFTQLGRFSIVYKQVFGESPSDTLRK